MSSTRSRRGFTLTELLVTVVVMAVLAVIAIPSASMGDKRKLDMLQLQLQDAIDHSQSLAYHTGQKVGVLFSVSGQWFSVVNALGVPMEDPLTHKMYAIRLNSPGQEQGVSLDYASFGFGRPLILFNTKGQLIYPGQLRISTGSTQRWFEVNTATGELDEVPIGG